MGVPYVSVILLTCNRETLLPGMLDSILDQTFQDFELILVNNGSSDHTAGICNSYRDQDSRIALYTLEKNNGAAAARNFAVGRAHGTYISMVDDDDYCEPGMLEHLVSLAKSYDADISITGCVDEYEDGSVCPKYVYDEIYVWEGEQGLSEFLKREKFHTAPATKLFRRELFEGLRWTEGTRVDDIHFIYKLFCRSRRVVAQGKPMYRFYKHAGNMTAFLSGDMLRPDVLDDYLNMQDERVAYISGHCPALAGQARYARVSYMISMIEKIKKGKAEYCERQLGHMVEYLKLHKAELLDQIWCTDRERALYRQYVAPGSENEG